MKVYDLTFLYGWCGFVDDAALWMIQLDAMYLIFDFEDLPRYLEGFALFTRKYDFFLQQNWVQKFDGWSAATFMVFFNLTFILSYLHKRTDNRTFKVAL